MGQSLRVVRVTLLVLDADEAEKAVESSPMIVYSTSRAGRIVGHGVPQVLFTEAVDALGVQVTWLVRPSAVSVVVEVALGHA